MSESPFEVVGVLSYDPETDRLSPVDVYLAGLTERVHGLQAALDHVHAAQAALTDPDGVDHQIRAYLSDARASLTVARDATAERIRKNEAALRPLDAERIPPGTEYAVYPSGEIRVAE